MYKHDMTGEIEVTVILYRVTLCIVEMHGKGNEEDNKQQATTDQRIGLGGI